MKFLTTILFLFFFEFAIGQVPGARIINNALFAKFTMSVGVNSTSSITFKIDVAGGVGQITEVGVVYGIAKGLTTASTLCNPNAATSKTFGTRVGTINYTSSTQWANTINQTVLSTDATNSTTSFYVAPYYARLYAVKNGQTYYGPDIEFLPNWPTIAGNGMTWVQANLGALRVATSNDDADSYGWFYQWGKPTDGHQFKNSTGTSAQTTLDIPPTGAFYSDGQFFWQKTTEPYNNNVFNGNTDLWNGVNGKNNPCPTGWRLPTVSEWASFVINYINNASSSGSTRAFDSFLKLPRQGFRDKGGAYYTYAQYPGADFTGAIWSGDAGKPGWSWMHLNENPGFRSSDDGQIGVVGPPPNWGYQRRTAYGFAVRCVQN
jgi:uncharacterized protein (TIGR02145 family)